MDSDLDEVIEVAGGGGGETFTSMTYYNSWTKHNYSVALVSDAPNDDKVVYSCPNLSSTSSGDVGGTLWLFNDGTTPVPNNVITHYLSTPEVTKFNYTGTRIGCDVDIRPILSAFDPSLITSLDDLLALASASLVGTTVFWEALTESGTTSGSNASSLGAYNSFYASLNSNPIYGIAIILSHFSGFSITAIDSTITMNRKSFKVVTA